MWCFKVVTTSLIVCCATELKKGFLMYLVYSYNKPILELKSLNELNFVVLAYSGAFQDHARFFNSLPRQIRNCTNSSSFIRRRKGLFSPPIRLI